MDNNNLPLNPVSQSEASIPIKSKRRRKGQLTLLIIQIVLIVLIGIYADPNIPKPEAFTEQPGTFYYFASLFLLFTPVLMVIIVIISLVMIIRAIFLKRFFSWITIALLVVSFSYFIGKPPYAIVVAEKIGQALSHF